MSNAVIILAVLILGLGGLYLLARKENRRLRGELESTGERLSDAVKQIDSIVDIHNGQQVIREESDEEKQRLENTPDTDLADRANSLFK